MAALAICAVTAALLRDRTDTQAPPPLTPDQPPPTDPGMVPLTVAQVKHLLAALATPGRRRGRAACWLDWERRHQARARWDHQRTRLARDAPGPAATRSLLWQSSEAPRPRPYPPPPRRPPPSPRQPGRFRPPRRGHRTSPP